MDTHSYKGWLNSDDQTKRIFAVWGHCFLAQWIIFCLILIAGIVVNYTWFVGRLIALFFGI